MRSAACRYIVFPLLVLCGGCGGWQSAMDPQGPDAHHLRSLIWHFVIVGAVIWLMVMLVLAAALWRGRAPSAEPLPHNPNADRRSGIIVAGAVAATVLIIGVLTLESYLVTRDLAGSGADPIAIRLRGYQWWWEVIYLDPAPSRVFATANEIHVPVGRRVHVELAAADVIHSFWVPNLAGKQDLIPGRDNALDLTASNEGIYRGPCAEFCGLQHAHMSLFVMAEPPDQFEAWRNTQLSVGAAPGNDEQKAGQQVFTDKACAACHTVRGTTAAGTLGPDLTHLASRTYLAAGLLPITRGSIAAWVADPQTIKPGNNMPSVPLTGDELRAVSAYLATLK
jgi:cytochrome c oxidase subunit II